MFYLLYVCSSYILLVIVCVVVIIHSYTGVTGNALPADIALFLASGADQVLLKPLKKAQFMTALLSFIDKENT